MMKLHWEVINIIDISRVTCMYCFKLCSNNPN